MAAILHDWLDSWSGLAVTIAGMTYQGWDVQLTAYAARDRRANFFPVGIAHSMSAAPRGSRRHGKQCSCKPKAFVARLYPAR
jgi:hypothetical protein